MGRPATLAVIDPATGEVIESGPELVEEVWGVAAEAYRRYLVGKKIPAGYVWTSRLVGNKEPD